MYSCFDRDSLRDGDGWLRKQQSRPCAHPQSEHAGIGDRDDSRRREQPRQGGVVPNPVTVAVGGTVTWNNTDTASSSHNVTSDTGIFVSQNFANAGTFSFTFQTRGTFPYTCTRHAGMAGTVTVQ